MRLREAILLVKTAKASNDPVMAGACSKSATVLVAAALERYVIDALHHACHSIKVDTWNDLPTGFKSILVAQIARRLRKTTELIRSPGDASDSNTAKLHSIVGDSSQAFSNPSSWTYEPRFRTFGDGAKTPAQLNAILREFRPDGKNLFDRLEERGLDKARFARALMELVNTRHATAHATPYQSPISPSDISSWLGIIFRLVREIEHYLGEAVAQLDSSSTGEMKVTVPFYP